MDKCLVKLVDHYFQNSTSLLVINGHDRNFIKDIKKPIVIATSFNFTKVKFKIDSIIIFEGNESIDNVWKITSKTSDTKFIVVADRKNLSIVTQCFWKLKLLSVLILVETEEFTRIYTYNPFFNQNCSEMSKPELINVWDVDKGTFSNTWKDFNKFSVNLMQCPVNISFMDFPPFVIRNKVIENVEKIAGIEGNFMEILAVKWNFTPNYINRHEQEWGNFEPEPTGLLGDVYTGVSAIGFGGLYPFPIRYEYLDTPITHNIQDASVFVTFEGAGAKLPEWATMFSIEFTPIVWISVSAAFLFYVILSFYLQIDDSQEISATIVKNLGLFLGQYQKIDENWTIRHYTLAWVWFGFVITSAYQSFLSGRLTAPPHHSNINTMKELVKSNLSLSGPRGGLILLNVTGEDESSVTLRRIFEKSEPEFRNIADMLQVIVKNKRNAFMHHYPILKYYASTIRNVTNEIHFLEEWKFQNYPCVLLPKGSFLKDKLGGIINGLNSGGLFLKWEREVFVEKKSKERKKPESLKINKFYAILIVFCGGCALSFIVALMEILHVKRRRKLIVL